MRAPVIAGILLLASLPVHADTDSRLFVRPWVELEPLVRIESGQYPIPLETATRKLLEEARVLLSGMVYGWSFDYTPADKSRGVVESFALAPAAQIPWGSPRLRVVETETLDRKLWARVSYTMDDNELARRSSWESGTASLSMGAGEASVMQGPPAKSASFQGAVRDAIRLSLRSRYLDAPRQVTGEVVLWDDPQTTIHSGVYRTTAKVKFTVRELVPYRIF
jgi:hypothetical protein